MLYSAPGTFQSYINNISYYIFDVYATAYLDNIFIYLDNVRDYQRYVNNVFDRFTKVNLSVDIDEDKVYTI